MRQEPSSTFSAILLRDSLDLPSHNLLKLPDTHQQPPDTQPDLGSFIPRTLLQSPLSSWIGSSQLSQTPNRQGPSKSRPNSALKEVDFYLLTILPGLKSNVGPWSLEKTTRLVRHKQLSNNHNILNLTSPYHLNTLKPHPHKVKT